MKNFLHSSKMELFATFFKIGLFTFGGGFAMLSLIDHECVTKKGWLTPEEMLDMTAISESTPGPIAINCATFVGYKEQGVSGAAWATFGVVLPSFITLYIISKLFVNFAKITIVNHALLGIRIGVAILIIQTAIKMLASLLDTVPSKPLCLAFFATTLSVILAMNLLGFHLSSIYLIAISAFLGYLVYGRREQK